MSLFVVIYYRANDFLELHEAIGVNAVGRAFLVSAADALQINSFSVCGHCWRELR